MAFFEINGVKAYIDGRLKRQIDKKVIPDLKKKDKDRVFVIDGGEGTGKSQFGIHSFGAYIAYCLNAPLGLDDVCMTPEEFRKRIIEVKKKSVVIFDEAHRGFGSINVLSQINKILTDLMMEMRQKNLCVIIIMPTFFMLNKYVALFRANGLFHVYENKGNRGYWVFYNRKNKLKLYLKGKKDLNYNCMTYPRFRGRFFNTWAINEEEYRKKKGLAFEKRPRMIRAEKYIKQRDRLVLLLHNEFGFGSKKLTNLAEIYGIGIKREGFRAILGQFRPKEGVGRVYKSINIPTKDKGESENNKKIKENLEKSEPKIASTPKDFPKGFKRLLIPQEEVEGSPQDYDLTDLAEEKEQDDI